MERLTAKFWASIQKYLPCTPIILEPLINLQSQDLPS